VTLLPRTQTMKSVSSPRREDVEDDRLGRRARPDREGACEQQHERPSAIRPSMSWKSRTPRAQSMFCAVCPPTSAPPGTMARAYSLSVSMKGLTSGLSALLALGSAPGSLALTDASSCQEPARCKDGPGLTTRSGLPPCAAPWSPPRVMNLHR